MPTNFANIATSRGPSPLAAGLRASSPPVPGATGEGMSPGRASPVNLVTAARVLAEEMPDAPSYELLRQWASKGFLDSARARSPGARTVYSMSRLRAIVLARRAGGSSGGTTGATGGGPAMGHAWTTGQGLGLNAVLSRSTFADVIRPATNQAVSEAEPPAGHPAMGTHFGASAGTAPPRPTLPDFAGAPAPTEAPQTPQWARQNGQQSWEQPQQGARDPAEGLRSLEPVPGDAITPRPATEVRADDLMQMLLPLVQSAVAEAMTPFVKEVQQTMETVDYALRDLESARKAMLVAMDSFKTAQRAMEGQKHQAQSAPNDIEMARLNLHIHDIKQTLTGQMSHLQETIERTLSAAPLPKAQAPSIQLDVAGNGDLALSQSTAPHASRSPLLGPNVRRPEEPAPQHELLDDDGDSDRENRSLRQGY